LGDTAGNIGLFLQGNMKTFFMEDSMSFHKLIVTGVVASDAQPTDDGLLFTIESTNKWLNGGGEEVSVVTPYDVALRNPVGQRMVGIIKPGVRVALIAEFISEYPRIDAHRVSHYDVETYNITLLDGADLQCVVVAGNLGRDADMRYTPDAVPVSSGSIAANRKRGDKKETIWFRFSVWRKAAEVAAKWFTTGKGMVFIGRLQVDQETGRPRIWQTNDMEDRSSYEMTVDNFGFMGGGNGSPPPPEYQGQASEAESIPF